MMTPAIWARRAYSVFRSRGCCNSIWRTCNELPKTKTCIVDFALTDTSSKGILSAWRSKTSLSACQHTSIISSRDCVAWNVILRSKKLIAVTLGALECSCQVHEKRIRPSSHIKSTSIREFKRICARHARCNFWGGRIGSRLVLPRQSRCHRHLRALAA